MSGELESVDFWSVVLLHTTPKGPVAVLHDLADRDSAHTLCGTRRQGGDPFERGGIVGLLHCDGCTRVVQEIELIARPPRRAGGVR